MRRPFLVSTSNSKNKKSSAEPHAPDYDPLSLRDEANGSGYESEDSSSNNLEGDSASGENPEVNEPKNVVDMHGPIQADFESFVLKFKSVYKCRICPRIVCLTEETIKTHLESKRHTRSKKLFGEGRLKLMLNNDGEIEEDGETHAERHARIVNLLKKDSNAPKAKDSGRQRQSRRRKRSSNGRSDKVNKEKAQKQASKRRKE